MGFEKNLEVIYSEVDLVCFPSHDPNPGRPIFEAGFFGVPSIACIENPEIDTFIPDVTGFKIDFKNPLSLAHAIMCLNDNPEKRLAMGNEAKKLSFKNFDALRNAKEILKIYKDLINETKK